MLQELRMDNFKGFAGEHSAELKPITLVYGPNSAGKSALLQAIALLTQSMPSSATEAMRPSPLTFKGAYVDLGDYQGVVNGHGRGKSLRLGMTHTTPVDQVPRRRRGRRTQTPPESLSFDAVFRESQRQVSVTSLHYRIPSQPERDVSFRGRAPLATNEHGRFFPKPGLGLRTLTDEMADDISVAAVNAPTRPSLSRQQINELYKAITNAPLHPAGFLPERVDVERLEPSALEAASPTEESMLRLSNLLLSRWSEEVLSRFLLIRRVLASVRYLGPLREAPRRVEVRAKPARNFVGPGGEDTSFLLHEQPELLGEVDKWLHRLEIPYSLKVERVSARGLPTVGELLTLLLTDHRTKVAVSPKDVGFGISQVLPVLTQCVAAPSGTLLIEQPEIHLHPRLQANLADLFLDTARKGGQIIAETHSESLLLRIQRRIRQGEVDPESIAILYVGNTTGVGSWVESIGLDQAGDFTSEWPDGFFEERLDELVDP